jgi:long-chain acyl-CoA synthetase
MAVGEETPYWDTIVFSKIKARFGGRIRVVISGSAPLSPTVQHFLRVYVTIFSGTQAT